MRMMTQREVRHTVQKRNTYRVWCENLQERDHLEEPSVDCRILKKILKAI
jgi:hypothetical protein